MYMGINEWTISPGTDSSYGAFKIYDGYITSGSIWYTSATGDDYAVRPTFYLKSNVAITGGTGTSSDPYRLALN